MRPWAKVARLTFSTLLNDGHPHQAHWVELAADGEGWAERRPYSFRLLLLTDAEDGTAVSATDEAVLLYLQALDTNLADRAMALKLIVARQMTAGEFDRARATAIDARHTAEGLAASLRDKLDDTRRDVRTVDTEAADAAAHSRTGAAQHTGLPLRPPGCCASLRDGPAGRPGPRILCSLWAAGITGQAQGRAPGPHGTRPRRATGYGDHGRVHLPAVLRRPLEPAVPIISVTRKRGRS